jgi:hypothetical protein
VVAVSLASRDFLLFGIVPDHYEGESVNVYGFLYIVDRNFNTVYFDTNEYVSNLKTLNIGDEVEIVYNHNTNTKKGIVTKVYNENIQIQVDSTTLEISKEQPQTNTCFVFPTDKDDVTKFSKYMLKHSNVCFTLLQGDAKMTKTIEMILPTMVDVLLMWRDDITASSNQELEPIVNKYGYKLYNIDEKAFIGMKNLIEETTLKLMANNPTKNPAKKKFKKEFKSESTLLDFKNNLDKLTNYSKYGFENNFCDSEYHRMKYLSSQSDNGLLYLTLHISEYADKLFNNIQRNKPEYDKTLETINKSIKELEGKIKTIKCPSYEPEVKKTYKTMQELELDNFKTLPNIKEGDYCKLTVFLDKNEKETHTVYYRRVVIKSDFDVKEFWVQDKELMYDSCTDEKGIPGHTGLLKQKCIYDDKEKLCNMKEQYIYNAKIENLQNHKTVISSMMKFYDSYAQVKAGLQDNIGLLRQYISINQLKSMYEMYYETDIDYSEFIGDINAIDEDKFAHGEVGENIKYTKLEDKEDEDEDIDVDIGKIEDFVEVLVKQFGISLSTSDIDYIRKTYNFYNSESTLQANINVIRNKVIKNMNEALTHALSKGKRDATSVAEIKLRFKGEAEKKIKANETILKSEFYKNSVLYVCALFIIVVQLKLPDIKLSSGFSNCIKDFGLQGYPVNNNHKSLLKYVSCVIKQISSANDERLAAISKLTLEQINAGIRNIIEKLLEERIEEKEQLKLIASNLESIEEEHRSTNKTYGEWSAYRPILNVRDGENSTLRVVQYLHLFYSLCKQTTSSEKLGKDVSLLSGLLENKPFKDLYNNLKSQEKKQDRVKAYFKKLQIEDDKSDEVKLKDIALSSVSLYKISGESKYEYKVNDEYLYELLQNTEDDGLWDEFPMKISNLMEVFFNKMPNSKEILKKATTLFFYCQDDKVIVIKNALRTFVFNEMKCILGKIGNLWTMDYSWLYKLPQLDKKKKEHTKVENILLSRCTITDLIAEISINNDLHMKLKTAIENIETNILYSYEPYDIKDTDIYNAKKNIYVYSYIVVYVFYSVLTSVYPNTMEDMFDISHFVDVNSITDVVVKKNVEVVFSLCKYILETLVQKVTANSFNSADLSQINEELRENRKESIIKNLEKMESEKKQVVLELRKRGLLDWDELEETNDAAKLKDVAVKTDEDAEDEGKIKDKREEENEDDKENELMYERGENDDDDNDDMEDDGLKYDEIYS